MNNGEQTGHGARTTNENAVRTIEEALKIVKDNGYTVKSPKENLAEAVALLTSKGYIVNEPQVAAVEDIWRTWPEDIRRANEF